jgi:Tol biopolymer transport system component
VSDLGPTRPGTHVTVGVTSEPTKNGRFVLFFSLIEDLREGGYTARVVLRDIKRERTTVIDTRDYERTAPPPTRPPLGAWGGPSISANGRYVAFESPPKNGDDDRASDVFLYDRKANEVRLISRSAGGEPADRASFEPAISDNGRFVAFTSYATNLAPEDKDPQADVFVKDLHSGAVTLVSGVLGSSSRSPRGESGFPSISADGSRVAFLSDAADLVAGDTNRAVDAFVHDLRSNQTTRVSVGSDGGELEPFVYSEEATVYRDGVEEARISGNGRVVAFSSHANGLVPEDDNNVPDIFVHEIETGVTERVSVPTGGGDGYRAQDRACGKEGQCVWHIASQVPSISHDGRFVAFHSGAPLLYPGDKDAKYGGDDDLFVHDRVTTTTLLVNRLPNGTPSGAPNLSAGSVSSNGRWMTYTSDGRIAAADNDAYEDVFLQRLPRAPWRANPE